MLSTPIGRVLFLPSEYLATLTYSRAFTRGDSWHFTEMCHKWSYLLSVSESESWQCPIPTLFIFFAAFSSRSCSMPQFKHWTERIF